MGKCPPKAHNEEPSQGPEALPHLKIPEHFLGNPNVRGNEGLRNLQKPITPPNMLEKRVSGNGDLKIGKRRDAPNLLEESEEEEDPLKGHSKRRGLNNPTL